MDRFLSPYIRQDLSKKIVLITGPRQVGKTTLSRSLAPDFDYLNYDAAKDRIALKAQVWNRKKSVVIFDELHKMRGWKQWLKGIYDTEGIPPAIIVTGSAKLDTYKKVGDSLAGRFFQYRLHPIDIKEAVHFLQLSAEDAFDRLMQVGGFPEPFLENTPHFYRRWQQSHSDIILRQDLVDLASVRDIMSIETLIALLRTRVGSPVSYAGLARELDRDESTIKRWVQLLENMYVIFRVTPYAKNIAKSLQKRPKFYFYDTGVVEGDTGAKLENLVACALIKALDFVNDTTGIRGQLHYIHTKDGKELDFLILQNKIPTHVIEVKWAETHINKAFHLLSPFLPSQIQKIQLVREGRAFTTPSGVSCENAVDWLAQLHLAAG